MVLVQAGTKLVCAVLSLPVPSKSPHLDGEQVNSIPSHTATEYLEQKALQKFLLIGYSGSGSSTIFKQVSFGPIYVSDMYVHILLISDCFAHLCNHYARSTILHIDILLVLNIGCLTLHSLPSSLLFFSNCIEQDWVFFFPKMQIYLKNSLVTVDPFYLV